jgi:hypothetical protein
LHLADDRQHVLNMPVGLGRLDNPPALADLVEIGPIAELHLSLHSSGANCNEQARPCGQRNEQVPA